MHNKLPSLSIFFPAYNEEANIRQSVEEALRIAPQVAHKYEIIVVDDASRDATREVVHALEEVYGSTVRLVSHSKNKGYGGALTTGMRESRYEYIFFTDADLQFDLSELKLLVEHATDYDVVIGYRKKRNDPLIRLINAKGWNILNRILFGLKVRDIDGAFKLMKRNVVQNLPITSQGAMVSAEILIQLTRRDVAIKEVPVTHLPRTQGTPTGAKPEVIFKAFKEMFRVFMGEVGAPTRRQLITFAIVGAVNTGVDLLGYYALTRSTPYFALHYIQAKTLTFILGTLTSFFLNKYITFKQPHFNLMEVVRFYSVLLLGLVANIAATYVLTSIFGFFDLVSVIVATLLTFLVNFTGTKLFVFNSYEQK